MCNKPLLRPRHSFIQGFTLIEMLIAISLLAVVSLMSWRGLDAIARSRTQLDTRVEQLDHLRRLFSQFESDCAQLTPQQSLRMAPVQLLDNGLLMIRQVAVPANGSQNPAGSSALNIWQWQAVWYRQLPRNDNRDNSGGIERVATPPIADRATLAASLQSLLQTPFTTAPDTTNGMQRNVLLQGDATLQAAVWLGSSTDANNGWINKASALQTALPPFPTGASASTVTLPPLVTGLSMSVQQPDGVLKKLCVVGN